MIKNKLSKMKYALTSGLLISLISSNTVFAQTNKYARNLSSWLKDGIQEITVVAFIGIVAFTITKRKLIQTVIAVVLGGIILSIVYNPELGKKIGDYLSGVIFG